MGLQKMEFESVVLRHCESFSADAVKRARGRG